MLGKPLAALVIVLALRYPVRVALAVAVALAQIGEFTFMLAALGRGLGVLPEAATNALVGAAIVSISVNPILYRLVDPVEAWLARRPNLSRWLGRRVASPAPAPSADHGSERAARHRAVIVGYGPVGRTLSRLLRDNEVEPTVIELNLETMQRLREEGVPVVYGDAGHRDTQKAAGVDRAAALLLSASGLRNAEEIVRLARELNPRVRVLVRCAYLREMPALRKAGANGIFSGEGEVALAMTESILRELGAVPDQIDRERDRVRADLFGGPATAVTGRPSDGSPAADSVPLATPGPRRVLSGEEEAKQENPRPAGDSTEHRVPPGGEE
jgi:CPA2 family monovalent cation:H+ antiporter-2